MLDLYEFNILWLLHQTLLCTAELCFLIKLVLQHSYRWWFSLEQIVPWLITGRNLFMSILHFTTEQWIICMFVTLLHHYYVIIVNSLETKAVVPEIKVHTVLSISLLPTVILISDTLNGLEEQLAICLIILYNTRNATHGNTDSLVVSAWLSMFRLVKSVVCSWHCLLFPLPWWLLCMGWATKLGSCEHCMYLRPGQCSS